jgi:hypothetical protein
MEIASIINRIHMIGAGIMIINQSGFLFKTVIKRRNVMTGIGIMNTGITNILKKVTEASLTVVIMTILTGMKIMNTVTMGTGIHGKTGKDIIEFIRTDSITGNIIMMMTVTSSSGFATRMAANAFSIPLEGNIGNGRCVNGNAGRYAR